jgi:hypothetical protein
MNWLFDPATKDQHGLLFMLIVFIVAYLWFLGPNKKNFKNIFVAWTVCLILLVSVVGCIWLLFTFRIFPYTYGFGFLDQIYWMVIALIGFVAIQKLTIAISKQLKIYKDDR